MRPREQPQLDRKEVFLDEGEARSNLYPIKLTRVGNLLACKKPEAGARSTASPDSSLSIS